MMVYTLDNNSIQKFLQFLPNPNFAIDWLNERVQEGLVESIELVYIEIMNRKKRIELDNVKTWASKNKDLFANSESLHTKEHQHVVDRCLSTYRKELVDDFSVGADTFLIARALATGSVLVTEESRKKSEKQIRIPNVCEILDIECMSAHGMVEHAGYKFSIIRK